MAKKVYLITRRGLGYRVSKSPPGEGEHGVQFESENGIAWDASEIQGGGVDPNALLTPLSYIKVFGNEFNADGGGNPQGTGARESGGVFTGIAYGDIADGSAQAWFAHAGKTASKGEWTTGGIVTVDAVWLWIDNNDTPQVTPMTSALGGPNAQASGFGIAKLFNSAIRPKVGSRYYIHWRAIFTNFGYYSHARADYNNGEALRYGGSGSIAAPSATPYANTYTGAGDYWGPCFVGGNIDMPSFRQSGDSNQSGVGPPIADTPDLLNGAIGAGARLLLPFMPGIDVSIPGGSAQENVDPAKNTITDMLMKLGRANKKNVYLVGFNDILNMGRTSAQVRDDLAAQQARHGGGSIWHGTLTPKTTSQASNTVPNAGQEAIRQAENTRRRADTASVIDLALDVETVAKDGTWKRPADQIDGTHLSTQGSKNAAANSGFNPATKMGVSPFYPGYDLPAATVYRNKNLAGWILNAGAARAAQDAYSPEHKLNAAVIRELAADNNHSIVLTSSITGLASTTKEYSVSIARGVGSRHAVVEIGKNGGNYYAMKYAVNLSTGAITAAPNEGTVQVTQSAVATLDPDGFWRVVIRITYDATMPNNPYLFVRMVDSPTEVNPNYVGDNTSTLKIWGFDVK